MLILFAGLSRFMPTCLNHEKVSNYKQDACWHIVHIVIDWGRDTSEHFGSVSNLRWKERRTSARLHGSRGASACGTVREGKTCWTAARPSMTPTRLQMGSTWPSAPSSRSSIGSCWRVRTKRWRILRTRYWIFFSKEDLGITPTWTP